MGHLRGLRGRHITFRNLMFFFFYCILCFIVVGILATPVGSILAGSALTLYLWYHVVELFMSIFVGGFFRLARSMRFAFDGLADKHEDPPPADNNAPTVVDDPSPSTNAK